MWDAHEKGDEDRTQKKSEAESEKRDGRVKPSRKDGDTHRCFSNDLVVDVCHTHHLEDTVSLLHKHAAHDIQCHIGAGVSDVRVVIDCWPAGVPGQWLPARQRLLGFC